MPFLGHAHRVCKLFKYGSTKIWAFKKIIPASMSIKKYGSVNFIHDLPVRSSMYWKKRILNNLSSQWYNLPKSQQNELENKQKFILARQDLAKE